MTEEAREGGGVVWSYLNWQIAPCTTYFIQPESEHTEGWW